MKLEINDKAYTVTEESLRNVLQSMWKEFLTVYESDKIPEFAKVLGMQITRHILKTKEKTMGLAARPPQGADPNLHLASMYMQEIENGLKNAHFIATADESNTVTSLTVKQQSEGTGGGQLASSGDEG